MPIARLLTLVVLVALLAACGDGIEADVDCGSVDLRAGESADQVVSCVYDAYRAGESVRYTELRYDEEGGDWNITYVLEPTGQLVKATGFRQVCASVTFTENDGIVDMSVTGCSTPE